MSEQLYYFIATKTTYPLAVPTIARDQLSFNRAVSNAFTAMAGGWTNAGDIVIRTVSTPPPNHLLCDGSTVNRIDFPQLAEALEVSEDAATFTLPDMVGEEPVVAPTAPTQTVTEGGTVEVGTPVVTEPTQPGQVGGTTGGNVISGGRPIRTDGQEE